MAHGFYYHSSIKHNDIIDFRLNSGARPRHHDNFKPNYDFVWNIYNDVAKAHGIKIPRHWVAVDAYRKADRYRGFKDDYYILEPLGPVVHVNMNYTMTGCLSPSSERGSVAYSFNWRKMAEEFFMVAGTAKQVLNDEKSFRHGYLCEKWRAKSMKLTFKR